MIKEKIAKVDPFHQLIYITLCFYLILWFANPTNKIIALSFVGLFFLYQLIVKSWRAGLWLTLLAAGIVFTGKQYTFEILPPGIYDNELFPDGVKHLYTITAHTIIAAIMTAIFLRDYFKKKLLKSTKIDTLVTVFFVFPVVADAIWSQNPLYSLMYSVTNLLTLGIYFFIRTNKPSISLSQSKAALVALVIFECIVASFQTINRSPIYKNLESQVSFELFGQVAEERGLPFRSLGTFNHANYFGLWLSFFLIFIFAIPNKNPSQKWGLLIITFITLITTLSRSAWIGTYLGLLISSWLIAKKLRLPLLTDIPKKIKYFLLLLIPFVLIFLLPRIEKSLYSFTEGGSTFRNDQFKESLQYIIAHPFTGAGSDQSLPELINFNPNGIFGRVPQTPHNWYLLVTIENGLLRLVLWLILIAFIVEDSLKAIRSPSTTLKPHLHAAFIAVIFSLHLIGMFQPFVGSDMIILTYAAIKNWQSHKKINR